VGTFETNTTQTKKKKLKRKIWGQDMSFQDMAFLGFQKARCIHGHVYASGCSAGSVHVGIKVQA
jgi:hypothetical protein